MNSSDRLRIMVVGGAGFIGTRLTSQLAREGHVVRVLDKKPPTGAAAPHLDRYIQGDVRNIEDLHSAIADTDLVYNLAAEHQDNVRPLSLYTDVNVLGARNVCDAATRAGVTRIIFTSSVAVYGAQAIPMNESAEHRFFNEYGRTKHLAELEFNRWLEASAGNRLIIVRPTVIFGPGNRGNVYNFLRQMKHGPFLMFGDGSNIKSVACVENIAAFLAFLASSAERCGVYNYADKPDLSVRELVAFVDATLGKKSGPRRSYPVALATAAGRVADAISFLIRRPLPLSAVRVQKFCAPSEIDASKALATGFQPPVSVKDGLRDMILNHV